MRKPCEYVSAAMAKLRGGSLSGCSEVLHHGEQSATVTRVGLSQKGGDEVTDAGVPENCRVLANVADFPALQIGEAVELGTSLRVVTSCATGPINTLLTVGLSAAFEKCPAAYTGTRREAGHVRQIKHPLDILLLESGTADLPTDAIAPTYATAYTVAIRRDDWQEVTAPDPSDTIEVAPGGHPFTLKVSTVTRHDGWYILKCRTRG
jgi:hypothetical protein